MHRKCFCCAEGTSSVGYALCDLTLVPAPLVPAPLQASAVNMVWFVQRWFSQATCLARPLSIRR